jgi:3-oxoadipate enol-lactonase
VLPTLLGRTTQETRPGVVDTVRRLAQAASPEGLGFAIARMMNRPDATALASEAGCPALVIVGEEDQLTPVDDARALAAALPDATLEIIPAAGHLANLENPDAFKAAMRAFLDRRFTDAVESRLPPPAGR